MFTTGLLACGQISLEDVHAGFANMGKTSFPATLSGAYDVAMLSGLTPLQQANFGIFMQYWPEAAVPTRLVLYVERTPHVLG